jgi:hypothetical protein
MAIDLVRWSCSSHQWRLSDTSREPSEYWCALKAASITVDLLQLHHVVDICSCSYTTHTRKHFLARSTARRLGSMNSVSALKFVHVLKKFQGPLPLRTKLMDIARLNSWSARELTEGLGTYD